MPNNKKFITLDNLKKFARELKANGGLVVANSADEIGNGVVEVQVPWFEQYFGK